MSEVDLEQLEPEGYMQPRRYKVTYQCERCAHQWTRITTKLSGKQPPCPLKKCREDALEEEIERRALRLAKMLEERRAPATIGANVMVKAVDTTADIVMKDFGMTNLKDNVREGEGVAPKLPPTQQKMADNYFGSANLAERYGGGRARKRQLDILGARAMAGAYRGMAINPGQVIPGQEGERILRSLGPTS